jgi:FAD/FMN-containing dehydrogenase
VVVEAASLAGARATDELLSGLRALGPEIDTFATIPAAALSGLHMDPEHPVPGVGDHTQLAELPDEAVEALVLAAGPGSGSPLLSVELRQLGGALDVAAPGHGALATMDAAFAVYGVGIALDERTAQAVDCHLALVIDALSPWEASRRYLNFVDRPADPARSFPPQTYARLRAVKAAYDPNNLFRSNHPIPPTA